jgi:hypothetical protein
MDDQEKTATTTTQADVAPPTTGRREFVAKLAKAAIVPAVVIGVAASVSPAHAGY